MAFFINCCASKPIDRHTVRQTVCRVYYVTSIGKIENVALNVVFELKIEIIEIELRSGCDSFRRFSVT